MIAKLPIVSSPLTLRELWRGMKSIPRQEARSEFNQALSELLRIRYAYLTNSGTSAFFIILSMLKEKSARREVVLPAYTAGNLLMCVRETGLTPVLCDVSLDDFNLDRRDCMRVVTENTLAVVPVHMFGVGIHDIQEFEKGLPSEVTCIEDCAQAMGSSIRQIPCGSFAKVSFFSFNRGKNFPLVSGGCIATQDETTAKDIERHCARLSKKYSIGEELGIMSKLLAFSLARNHFVYGLGYPVISKFKDTAPLARVRVGEITPFQARLGLGLLKKSEALFKKRYENGMRLSDALKGLRGLRLPEIRAECCPAFNRFPIVIDDPHTKTEIEKELWKAGIESSGMYERPLHHMFDTGYQKGDFPNACYLAEHLITLPVHPLVTQENLLKITEIISRELQR